ncbi:CrcB family protein [uncultured Tessaracoccus sp.]|uniref:fluoride efflux transporter FluC n=1 Tax=uncultured Tessaracoccus sp. TaxID=905023 RepID=UPI0026357BC6|nr:CrcB family protein [uncultured Tessaracoccus sp.]
MVEFLLVMASGGVGATARFLVDSCFAAWNRRFPIGILVVNTLGSFALGWIVGLGAAHVLSPTAVAVLGVGFCGGFTTFSTAAVDAAKLLADRRVATFVWQWLGGFLACLVAGAMGWLIGVA